MLRTEIVCGEPTTLVGPDLCGLERMAYACLEQGKNVESLLAAFDVLTASHEEGYVMMS